jgi:membrane protease YdiL (CAAX protease family)
MSLSWNFILTFGTLAAAIAALWLPAPEVRGDRSWLWAPVLGLACLAGVATGFLTWQAPCWLALYAALALWARETSNRWLRVPLMLLTWVAPFLFAAHRFPGFANPLLADQLQFSAGAPAFSIRANFDMAAVGAILAGVFCQRMRTLGEWLQMLRKVWPVTVSTLIVVLGLGMLMGYVRPDLKWTPYSLYFLGANLLFTCVTEEAFFRGFTFAGLSRLMSRWRFGTLAAGIVSALLFGIAHARGGALLIVLATVAGLHYAAAYAVSKRVEGAILTHFALNAVHFVAFTYPNLSS